MIASGGLRRAWLATFAIGAFATAARGEQMRLAASTPIEMQVGEAQGMAVTSLGRIFPSPKLTSLGASGTAGFPSQVLTAAADESGNVFLGTGPDGEILKVTRGGERALVARLDEPIAGVAAGQALVSYRGSQVVGSATISETVS